MLVRRFGVILSAIITTVLAAGQQPPDLNKPRWALLIDPICPVSSPFRSVPNASKEMKVMYFPESNAARLKSAKALTLNVAMSMGITTSTEMTRAADGHWEAAVPLEKLQPWYAIFSIKDENGAVDDNFGRFWDVVFCDADGRRDLNGIIAQARSYTGLNWPGTPRKHKDYARAIKILQDGMGDWQGFQDSFYTEMWQYEAERDGNDAAAWANVVPEIEQFLKQQPRYESGTVNFIVNHADKLPREFADRMAAAEDVKHPDAKETWISRLEYSRAAHEKDPVLKLAALDAIIAKYPDSVQNASAQRAKFSILAGKGDIAGAEDAYANYAKAYERFKDKRWDMSFPSIAMQLASLYIDKNIKLNEALKVLDDAMEPLKRDAARPKNSPPYPLEYAARLQAQFSALRARALLRLNKPMEALPEAQKADDAFKSADTRFALAQALAGTGQKQKALDAYFEAALMPSNKDLEYGAELQSFYVANHFGKQRQFEDELQRRKAQRFQKAKYVPKLIEREGPAFEFIALTGERFSREMVKERTVVVNFWSPG